jgi:hypothetical protein
VELGPCDGSADGAADGADDGTDDGARKKTFNKATGHHEKG